MRISAPWFVNDKHLDLSCWIIVMVQFAHFYMGIITMHHNTGAPSYYTRDRKVHIFDKVVNIYLIFNLRRAKLIKAKLIFTRRAVFSIIVLTCSNQKASLFVGSCVATRLPEQFHKNM